MVVFILAFIISMPVLWLTQVNKVYNDCEKNALSYYGGAIPNPGKSLDDFNGYYNALRGCNDLENEWWTLELVSSIIIPIIIFYLLQLIFFKVIINYIVLGNKNKLKF